MFPCLTFSSGYWWIIPFAMIAMMALCFFMMKGRGGSMMCGPGFRSPGSHSKRAKQEEEEEKKQ